MHNLLPFSRSLLRCCLLSVFLRKRIPASRDIAHIQGPPRREREDTGWPHLIPICPVPSCPVYFILFCSVLSSLFSPFGNNSDEERRDNFCEETDHLAFLPFPSLQSLSPTSMKPPTLPICLCQRNACLCMYVCMSVRINLIGWLVGWLFTVRECKVHEAVHAVPHPVFHSIFICSAREQFELESNQKIKKR